MVIDPPPWEQHGLVLGNQSTHARYTGMSGQSLGSRFGRSLTVLLNSDRFARYLQSTRPGRRGQRDSKYLANRSELSKTVSERPKRLPKLCPDIPSYRPGVLWLPRSRTRYSKGGRPITIFAQKWICHVSFSTCHIILKIILTWPGVIIKQDPLAANNSIK